MKTLIEKTVKDIPREKVKNEAIHICFSYHVYPSINGGAELIIQKLAESMVKRGYQITVVCSDRNKNKKNEEYINGVRVIYVKSYFDIFKVPFAPTYFFALWKIKPDLIHCHGTAPGFSDVAVIYAKFRGIPCLLTYHFDGNADGVLGQVLSLVYNFTINSLIVRLANKITATGKSYAETSPVLKKVMNKVTIVPNGIDIKHFNTENKIIKGNYKLPKGKIILWVGRFVKYKGLAYLIEAMKKVDNATLLIIGSGMLERELKELVKKDNLGKKIKFVGQIKNRDLPYFYHKAYIYVLSSITRGENFSISSLEALGCGVPVIASDLPGVRDMISKNVGIKVLPKNSTMLEGKINFLLRNEEKRKEMSRAASKKAKLYSLDTIIGRYYELYKELLRIGN